MVRRMPSEGTSAAVSAVRSTALVQATAPSGWSTGLSDATRRGPRRDGGCPLPRPPRRRHHSAVVVSLRKRRSCRDLKRRREARATRATQEPQPLVGPFAVQAEQVEHAATT